MVAIIKLEMQRCSLMLDRVAMLYKISTRRQKIASVPQNSFCVLISVDLRLSSRMDIRNGGYCVLKSR